MKLSISENQKESLLCRFNQLKTIVEKFDFWITELDLPYYEWPYIDHEDIEPFLLHPKNGNEIEQVNKKCIELFKARDENKPGHFNHLYFLSFDDLKAKFLDNYGSAKNKKNVIDEEKRKTQTLKSDIFKRIWYVDSQNSFDRSFNDFCFMELEPDLSEKLYQLEELFAVMNGYVLAQYLQFLNEFSEKPEKKAVMSHIVQMLILEYLGLGKEIQNNRVKSEIYGSLIGRDIETTRQIFSRIQTEKTEKNLQIILNYFEKANLPNLVQAVQSDIDRLNKKKK